MNFFNSFSTRIPLAVTGAILYGLLTYVIAIFLRLSPELSVLSAVFVFLIYFGSRLLILLSGIDSLYYSRGKTVAGQTFEKDYFYQTTQWVGKFYHYHDIVLLVFLVAVSIAFLMTLGVDLLGAKSIGHTFRNIWNSFIVLL